LAVSRQVHAAGHVVQRLLLHLLLDLAGVTKAEHRHAAHHQRHGDHQQIKNQQAASGAGEKRGRDGILGSCAVWCPHLALSHREREKRNVTAVSYS
jgi:hypothetical protein